MLETEATLAAETALPTEATLAPTEPDRSLRVQPGSYLQSFTDEATGDYLDYYIFIPENPVKDMPLIVYLHGDGNVGDPESLVENELIRCVRDIYGERFPFILISPCTRTASWIRGTIPETLKHLIDHTVAQYETEPKHIELTGFSRGSIGVWHMISAYGGFFSAAVPVSCGNETALNLENCVQVPVLAFAGNIGENEWMYYNAMENNVLRIQQAGGNAEMRLLDGCSHTQTPNEAYTADTIHWMLEQ